MLKPRTIPLLALLILLLIAPATHAAGWAAPVNFPVPSADLFEGGPDEDQIAYQNGGTATEAFIQLVSLKPFSTVLHVGTMAPGSSYSDQLVVPSQATGFPVKVQIAVAPNGAAVAGWIELTGENDEDSPARYLAAYRPAGSTNWESPYLVATEAQRASGINPEISVAISAKGSAAVGAQYNANEAGAEQGEATSRIDVAVRPESGAWSTERISPAHVAAEELKLGFDHIGNLTAVYKSRYSEGPSNSTADDRYIVIAREQQGSSHIWGPQIEISGLAGSAADLQFGEDEEGDAVVAYQYTSAGVSLPWAATRLGAEEKAWSEPSQLVLTGSGSAPEAAGVAPNGTAYVLYRFNGTSSGENCEGVVRAQASHAFTPEHCVSSVNEEGSPGAVAFLGNDAYLAWKVSTPGSGGSGGTAVQAAHWANGVASPEAALNLDKEGDAYDNPTLVPDMQGSVVAFYRDNTSRSLRAAAYDGGPPILLGVSVPGSATAGQPVTFSAALVDLWSGLGAGQPTWSFGDGTQASGATVTHTFATAGTYAITLNAADALDNALTGTYSIAVAPAPPPPPPPATGDRRPPQVTLDTPSCPRKLSKKACKRRRASTSAWRTLRGGVSDPAPSSGIASVQVAVYLTRGRRILGLSHGHFRATTKRKARAAFVQAKITGDKWSLKLPKLAGGTYTILVRASDRAGNRSTLLSRTVRLS